MQHPLIIPLSPAEQLATLAAGALDAASGQQTRATGSATYHNPDGTKTLIGADAAGQGIAPWVGDTTAPGMPTGISVDSSAGMILVSWDGSLDGGVPADFDHVQILVDGVEAGQLRVRGTAALGPYEADSVHSVSARAWDDAHAEDGSPAPNGSTETAPVSVTVRSVVDASQVQAAQDKAQEALDKIAGVGKDVQQASKDAHAASVASAQAKQTADAASGLAGAASSKADSAANAAADASSKADSASNKAVKAQATADGKNRIIASAAEPAHGGLVLGDLWMQLDPSGHVSGIQVWNGKAFTDYVLLAQQVLVAGSVGSISLADGAVTAGKVTASEALLEKLLVRRIKADEIDVGLLAAAIVKSGSFSTPDGLVGFDESGFWAKDQQGRVLFRASQDGVQTVGGVQTASRGDRIQLSQTLIQGSMTGGLQGIGDDPETPYWLIWGDHDEGGTASRLMMGTSTQQPEIAIRRDQQGRNTVGLTANKLSVSGSAVSVDTKTVLVQGIAAGFEDFDPAAWLGWSPSFQDYNHATRLYKRAGVYFLELNVQIKQGMIPSMQTIPVVQLADSIMPDHSLDVLAYGTSYAVGRFHVFGPGESQPQGTISIGTKDTTANFFSGQMFWPDPGKA